MFNCGPRQINPNTAADTVVVQDMSVYNYQLFLCGLRYNTSSILVFTGKTYVLRDSPHICRQKLYICHPQRLQGHNSSEEQSQMWDQENVCTGWSYMHQQAFRSPLHCGSLH